jgi:hypothetical protein
MVAQPVARDDGGMSTGAVVMNLLQALLSWHHHDVLPPKAVADAGDDAGAADDEAQPGCGWFDSSHDLRAGLQVREHAANDPVCAELPLAMWLELQQA